MPRKRYKPEEIVAKLRQVDVLVSQGQSLADAIRQIEAGHPDGGRIRIGLRGKLLDRHRGTERHAGRDC